MESREAPEILDSQDLLGLQVQLGLLDPKEELVLLGTQEEPDLRDLPQSVDIQELLDTLVRMVQELRDQEA